MIRIAVRLVDACRAHAGRVASAFLLISIACLWYTATGIRMDTDTDKLLAPDLPWKKLEADYDRSFPQMGHLLVAVIDGDSPGRADDAAAALTARLARHPDLFGEVRRADAPFLRRTALLYSEVPELRRLADRLTAAQPLIGTLAADPSARGVFRVIELALQGAARGQAGVGDLDPLLGAVADTARQALDGRAEPLPWYALFTGGTAGARELRRYVLIQPVLDFESFSATGSATETVRAAARELGLTAENGVRLRLTGTIAMEEEEFRSVAEGMEVAGAVSLLLVALLLAVGLRSLRLIVPILLTLLAGLTATFAFAVAAAGTLNPISVAFAVMFIGMAVDFGIQVATRYRDRHFVFRQPRRALIATARTITAPLLLAAATTAVGFLAFLPTDFVGVSQLGLIAGGGMVIAVIYNLTLLPALLTLFRPPAEAEAVDLAWLAPVDRLLARRARPILAGAVVLGAIAAVALPSLRFDFNPINLRDPKSEAVATAIEMMNSADTSPFTAQILSASPAEAGRLAERLSKLPEVGRTLSIQSFIPDDQAEKLAVLADLGLLLGPSLTPAEVAAPPEPGTVRAEAAALSARLRAVPEATAAGERLASALAGLGSASDATIADFGQALTGGLAGQLASLAEVLTAEPVTLDTIPESFRRDWVTADGRARVEVTPAGDGRDPAVLVDFVRAVRTVAPDTTGTAVTIQESARVIVDAFRTAGLIALAAIVIVLAAVLRQARDVAFVLAPLVLATLLTAATLVVSGLAINFANIIALPLLLGIGVAFAIYYVINHRAGQTNPLRSSTTRAVFFSAATTAVSFGSLAASAHRGTASMGVLLLVGLCFALTCTLVVLPALFALHRHRDGCARGQDFR